MVKGVEYAAGKYISSIRARGGASAWYDCGTKVDEGGVKAVAECMKGLKLKVTEEAWAAAYKTAYTGRV